MWVNEMYHRDGFSMATYFIVPGIVYCFPFIRLQARRVKYTSMIVPFLTGIPVIALCGLGVGFLVTCAMGDCL
jgi:hypothetical protein